VVKTVFHVLQKVVDGLRRLGLIEFDGDVALVRMQQHFRSRRRGVSSGGLGRSLRAGDGKRSEQGENAKQALEHGWKLPSEGMPQMIRAMRDAGHAAARRSCSRTCSLMSYCL